MSDLICRESVIKELNELRRYVPFPSSKDVFDIIMKAKSIEQGELVRKAVADALEEFAKAIKGLCNDYSSRNGSVYVGDVESAIDELLKQHILIKRNAPKEGE